MLAVLLAPPDGPTQAMRPDGSWIDVSVELTRTDREGGAAGYLGVLDAFSDVSQELAGVANVGSAHADGRPDPGSLVDVACDVPSESGPCDSRERMEGSATTGIPILGVAANTGRSVATVPRGWRIQVPETYIPGIGIRVDGTPFQVNVSEFKLLAAMSIAREKRAVVTKSDLEQIKSSPLTTLKRLRKKLQKVNPEFVSWIVSPGRKGAGGYRIL